MDRNTNFNTSIHLIEIGGHFERKILTKMAEILKNCPFLDIIYQKSCSTGAGLQYCPLCCFLKQKLEFEEFSRCLHGTLMQIVLFKMASKKAALGTVQNFLLGGVVLFWKSARKKCILPPPRSPRKILVPPPPLESPSKKGTLPLVFFVCV